MVRFYIMAFESHIFALCFFVVLIHYGTGRPFKIEARRLEAIREQILVRYQGCGLESIHSPWPDDNHVSVPAELLEHLWEIVILISKYGIHTVPLEPLLNLLCLLIM